MAKKIKLNYKGFRQLRTGDAAEKLIKHAAEKVARRAGDEFEAQRSPGRNRARYVVVPNTPEAARLTAENPNKLISALDAARQ